MTGSKRFDPLWLLPLVLALGFVTAYWNQRGRSSQSPELAPNANAQVAEPNSPAPQSASEPHPTLDNSQTQALRREIEELKRRVRQRESTVAALDSAAARPAAKKRSIEEGWIHYSDWAASGNDTAVHALESLLHAGASGDPEALMNLIIWDPEAAPFARDLFGLIPPDQQAEFGSPDRFAAMMTIDAIELGSASLAGNIPGDDDHTTLVLALRVEQAQPRVIKLNAVREPTLDEWRIVIPPDAIERFHTKLLGPLREDESSGP